MQSGIFFTTFKEDLTLRRTPTQKLRLALVLLALVIYPFFASNYYLTLANQVLIAAIGAIGLNILVGFTGQISLGQGGFMAVGAYGAGLMAAKLGLPFWLTIPLACLLTALVGTLFGLPSLRLKGLYLAIATLAAQEIIIWSLTNWRVTSVDAVVTPHALLFGFDLNGKGVDFYWYWINALFLAATVIFTVNLFRTRVGRAFIAIRDQDIAAQVMGIDIFRYKLLAFATSSFFVGLAGALTAHYRTIVNWERFTIEVSVTYLAMIIIGGLGSVAGSIYGALFITLLPALLNTVGRSLQTVIPGMGALIPQIQLAVFGIVIILFLVREPEGIAKLWRNVKDYFRLWPFSY